MWSTPTICIASVWTCLRSKRCICCLVDEDKIGGGGNKKELVGLSSFQQKLWTRHYCCSQKTGPGLWKVYIITYRTAQNVLNSVLILSTEIFPVSGNRVFLNKFCLLTCTRTKCWSIINLETVSVWFKRFISYRAVNALCFGFKNR